MRARFYVTKSKWAIPIACDYYRQSLTLTLLCLNLNINWHNVGWAEGYYDEYSYKER